MFQQRYSNINLQKDKHHQSTVTQRGEEEEEEEEDLFKANARVGKSSQERWPAWYHATAS